jgi:hypothetical protein
MIEPRLSAGGWAVLAQIEKKPEDELDASWVEGCADDKVLYGVLLNDAKLPEDTLALVPKKLQRAKAGMAVWRLLTKGVHTQSDAAAGEAMQFVLNPTPVAERQKEMLGSVLQQWESGVQEMEDINESLPELQKQQSLEKLVSQLPKVVAKWTALEAAAGGKRIPVVDYLVMVKAEAAKYNSVQKVKKAYGAVKVLAAGVPEPAALSEDTHKKRDCHFWKAGTCWRGSKCRFHHEGKPGGKYAVKVASCVRSGRGKREIAWGVSAHAGVRKCDVLGVIRGGGCMRLPPRIGLSCKSIDCAIGAVKPKANATILDPDVAAQCDLWLATKAAGVSRVLGLSVEEAEGMVLAALQEQRESRRLRPQSASGKPGSFGGAVSVSGAVALAVVADTGATVRVIGGADMSRAVNVTELPSPVKVHGAGGVSEVTHIGDLPGLGGLMTKCLLMPECASSLLPVVPVCRELGLGFEVDQGGEAGRFHRDGETVVELVVDGELLVVPEDLECMLCVGTVALHAELVLGLEHSQSGEPAWMKQHQLDGHPYDKRCPWCVQGRLKQRQHFRQLPGSGESLSGSRRVQLDFTGPYEPGVTGSKVALVGVETEDDWGYVGLQQDRSAQSTLVSIQDLEVEFTVDSNGRAGSIGHIHHDDDKSFRGVVERYIRSRGWRDTHTGGYNPNANAKAKVRIGMLKQLFRVALLCATGGQAYYPQL